MPARPVRDVAARSYARLITPAKKWIAQAKRSGRRRARRPGVAHKHSGSFRGFVGIRVREPSDRDMPDAAESAAE